MSNPDCPLLALGLCRDWRSVQGLQLDVGPFVQALTMLDAKASETQMIEDDLRGDVGGAQSAGLKAALVKIGKLQQTDLSDDIVPNGIVASFTELPTYWKSLE